MLSGGCLPPLTFALAGNRASNIQHTMKTNHAIWIVCILAAFVANDCRANLFGSDNFNDNSKDPSQWGTDFTYGGTKTFLTETNGRLEYTTIGVSAPVELCVRPWIRNFGSYTQDWEMRIDVNIPQLPQAVRLGLFVFPGQAVNAAVSQRFDINLENEAGVGDHWFNCRLAVNAPDTELGRTQTTSTSAALRVAFDSNTKVLSGYYDGNGPECGYTWTLLGSIIIPAGWSMTSNSVFGVAIFGFAQSASVTSADNVFSDNFAASYRPIPQLGISLAGEDCVVTWATNTPSYHLECTTTLTPPICWDVVTNAPGIVNTNFTVTNAVSGEARFYRLGR